MMFTSGFTINFSALNLLNVKEQGIVSHFRNTDDNLTQIIMKMGIIPGCLIAIEERFPDLVIQVGGNRITLDRQLAHLIYVRVKSEAKKRKFWGVI